MLQAVSQSNYSSFIILHHHHHEKTNYVDLDIDKKILMKNFRKNYFKKNCLCQLSLSNVKSSCRANCELVMVRLVVVAMTMAVRFQH